MILRYTISSEKSSKKWINRAAKTLIFCDFMDYFGLLQKYNTERAEMF